MNKSLENEYRQLAANDVPDLWDRIEASIDKIEEDNNKTEEKKVIPIKKTVNYMPALIAAAVCLLFAIPGFTFMTILFSLGSGSAAPASTSDYSEAASDSYYEAADEATSETYEAAASEACEEATAEDYSNYADEYEDYATDYSEYAADEYSSDDNILRDVEIKLVRLPGDKLFATIISDPSETLNEGDRYKVSPDSPAYDTALSLFSPQLSEVTSYVNLSFDKDGNFLLDEIGFTMQ